MTATHRWRRKIGGAPALACVTLAGMEIRELTADSDLVHGLAALGEAIVAVDSPWAHPATARRWRSMLAHGWDGEPPRYWVGVDDGAVVGSAGMWASDYDNLDNAWFDLSVHPGHRRRGLGTTLLRHLEQVALEGGRPIVGCDGWESDAARAFAAHHGYEQKSQGLSRRQYLSDLPAGWAAAADEARATHAAAYELVEVVGALPDPLVDPAAVLWAGINDAPTDDLVIEDEKFPVERIRGYERAQLEVNRLYHLLARHRETGELGGHTIVAVDIERPQLGDQHDTTVAADHRGHRLGLVLKAGMLQWLARTEPQLQEITTWNAESNDHMIAVNEQLGYRVMGRALDWQRTLSRG